MMIGRSGVLVLALWGAAAAAAELPSEPVQPPEASLSELAARADTLFDQGKWLEVRDVYQEMLGRFEQAGDVEGIARVLVGRSTVLSLLGRAAEDEAGLRRALSLLPSIAEESRGSIEAMARERLAAMYFDTGRPDEGTVELRKAQDFWQRTGQPDREVAALHNLGNGLRISGDLEGALSVFHEAEEIQRRLPADPKTEGDLLRGRVMIDLGVGKFQNALVGLYRVEHLYQQAGYPGKSEAIRFLIALVELFVGRGDEALSSFQRSIAASGLENESFVAQFVKFLMFAKLAEEERFQEAIDLGLELLPFWEKSGDRQMEALLRSLLGLSYFALGKGEEAVAQLARAAQAFRAAGAHAATDPTVELFSKMIQTLDAAEPSGQGSGLSWGRMEDLVPYLERRFQEQFQTLENRGRERDFSDELGLRRLNFLDRYMRYDQEGSLEELDKIIALLEQHGQDLTLGGLKAGFFGQFFEIYSSAVELCVTTGRHEAAFNYAEMARARAFIDQVGNQRIATGRGASPELAREERRLRIHLEGLRRSLRAEQRKVQEQQSPGITGNLLSALEEKEKEYEALRLRLEATSPEYAALVGLKALRLPDVQRQLLDERMTLIEYFIPESPTSKGGRGQVVAWVIEGDRFVMVPLPVSAGDLRARVALFRNLIEARQPADDQATKLYRDLFAPLVPHVRYRNLVIVPHGVLHFLPFAGLWDGKRYLGDVYTLSYSPSATAFKFAREKTARVTDSILAVGNPDGSLLHATREAEVVARLYRTKPLLGSAATENALLARASQAGILHLAAHAELNPINPLFTSVRLAPDGEHDGNLEMHEVYDLDLSRTGLVVLSACKTQMGKLSRGDEIEGLTRAFLYAGTPAVMSSLWDVDDESTALFMERFYRHLRKGKGRAEALRNAQAEIRKRFPDPYHWAAFVLTGDGR